MNNEADSMVNWAQLLQVCMIDTALVVNTVWKLANSYCNEELLVPKFDNRIRAQFSHSVQVQKGHQQPASWLFLLVSYTDLYQGEAFSFLNYCLQTNSWLGKLKSISFGNKECRRQITHAFFFFYRTITISNIKKCCLT